MKVSLLIIATEILEGKIKDLNGLFLSDFLRDHHLELGTVLTVRDRMEDIHRGLGFLLSDSDLVITSGGLGPTKDDLTKEALASFLGRKINYSSEAEKISAENYSRMGRPWPGSEHVYASLPDGFKALSNSTGFAPGLHCEHLGKHIFSAPGVPREFRSILHDHLAPWLLTKRAAGKFMENVTVRTKRVPEEKIFGELDPSLWEKLSALGEVSSLPVLMGVDIGVKLRANSAEELQEMKEKVLGIIQASPVHSAVWHIGREKLEEAIVSKANSKNITYGFAESCTGGLCSHRVTGISGSSKTFLGSVISYAESVKEHTLDVPHEVIEKFGVVSTETAEAMARGLARQLSVNLAISTTGIAGPTGGSKELPVGTVCIGVHHHGRTESYKYHFRGDRELLKERFSQAALLILLEKLEEIA